MNKHKILAVMTAAVVVILSGMPALAQNSSRHLVIGTREVPPFAMTDENGRWTGITIDLWEKIADRLGYSYEYQSFSLQALFDGLQNGTIDAAAAALSITSGREGIVDFSHPFYQTGLGIAAASRPVPTWWSVVSGLVSRQFLKVLGILTLILFVFGLLIWLFERRKNQAHFGGGAVQGIGSGFWWAAVTMTTVGYGDKAPATLAGRCVALVWMFSGIILISSITASITSALTVASLDSGIQGPQDLPKVSAGAVRNTTSADYFFERGMNPRLYETVREALEGLQVGEVQAVVYDAPTLAYLINQQYAGQLMVLPDIFEQQQYGIALPFNSSLRKEINQELLHLIESGEFEQIRQRYLGE